MSPSYKRSREIFDRSQEYLPGGVNSPVRAFHAVGMRPLVIDRGETPFLEEALMLTVKASIQARNLAAARGHLKAIIELNGDLEDEALRLDEALTRRPR